MQSINTNNLFMHGHEKWGGKQCCLPPLEKMKGQLPRCPVVPRSMHMGLDNVTCQPIRIKTSRFITSVSLTAYSTYLPWRYG